MHDDEDLLQLTRRLCLSRQEAVQPLRWRPPADIYRHHGGWLVKVELAGVAPDQVEVVHCGRLLCVRGRRRDLTLSEGYACYAMEIAYSEFERAFELPIDLDRARVATHYRDGMLLVHIAVEAATP